MHNFYFQDDIRVNNRLTVNAGLRYELVTPQWESNNLLANYDPTTQSLIQATPGSIYNRALVNMPKLDFAPRFGFAYQLDSKTVVRAAYGLGYAQFNREGGENMLSYNLPAIVNTNIVQAPSSLPPAFSPKPRSHLHHNAGRSRLQLRQPEAPASAPPRRAIPPDFTSPANVTAASNLSTEARYIPKNLPTGYVQSYHLTVQRQIANNTTFEASYVGEHGVKIQVLGRPQPIHRQPRHRNLQRNRRRGKHQRLP